MTSQHKTGTHPFYIGMYIHMYTHIYVHIYTSQKECLHIFFHIDWSIWAVASSGKAERIHKLASWVSDIQEILPRGGKKHTFNVDKWPLHVTFISISNTDSKSRVNRASNQKINASVLPVLTAKASAYNGKDFPLKSQVSIHGIYIHIYLEPK